MKKIFYGAFLTIVLSLIILSVGAILKIAPNLSYVYSNSMEPLIMINDGFLVIPVRAPQIGDIILYRPQKLEAELITHRIIGVGIDGFITKGDNSPSRDQDAGEPQVKPDRIVGRVLTIQGKPLVFHGFGQLMSNMKARLGTSTDYLAAGLVLVGVVIGLREIMFPKRKRKSRHRWRLRDIYRVGAIVVTILALSSILLSYSINQVKYLVSQSPGTLGDQVQAGEAGDLT
ncbi:MAG: signal peptidase I, partial [Sphingobacteriia bacterium]|nr:signal peptidase I [Sphingobacteriia bacterium]